ncbi:MAG: hypothetical protein JJ895_07855 [Balneolaceae bacterium]|nr:hypothetical protein [Balneolaceae bacterium]
MKTEQNHLQDIAEIRSIMERSTKFFSLSGLAGVSAGIFALAGAGIVYTQFGFNPDSLTYTVDAETGRNVILIAFGVLFLAMSSAAFLSQRKASKSNEVLWSSPARRLLANVAIPLFSGGLFALIMHFYGYSGFLIPITLIFYGHALVSAGSYTYNDLKVLGVLFIILGLMSVVFIQYSLIIWCLGFGLSHIIYGVFMHIKYER